MEKQCFVVTIYGADKISPSRIEGIIGDYMDNRYDGDWDAMKVEVMECTKLNSKP